METFTPLKIGSKRLSNRLIMAPVKTAYGTPEGMVTHRHEAYYRRRAEGGVAAIIVEPLYVDQVGREHPKQIGISSCNHAEGLHRLITAIHDGGALAIAHLNHGGRAANPKASGFTPEAPSVVKCNLTGVTPLEMSEERIEQVIREFGAAARRALEVGFDLIELQFGLGYLVAQFLSPATNLRHDGYGGNKKNRYRFATEVLRKVRSEVGADTPIMVRISATDQATGGRGIEDSIDFASFMQVEGADAIHVASGSICDSPPWYFQHMRLPLGKNLNWAGKIRGAVDIPVIVAGRLGNPDDIRHAFANDTVDGIALGRPLVADPDLPRKMKENAEDEILLCGACLQGCLGKVKSGEGLTCIVNPEAGNESKRLSTSAKPKRVVVVGGGPGGMQAALTASQRGHKVILYEKNELGGQFRISYIPPGKEMMKRPFESILRRLKSSQIEIRRGREATASDILSDNPDAVIIATGAAPIIPPIEGLEEPLTGEEVLGGKQEIGKRVLIVGGGMIGLEVAEHLVRMDKEVTVVEILEDVARDMLPITRKLTINSLTESGVAILTGTELSRIEDKKAFLRTKDGERLLGDFESVVLAVGTRPVNDLEAHLKSNGVEVKVVGDARQPRQVLDAVKEGFEVAIAL